MMWLKENFDYYVLVEFVSKYTDSQGTFHIPIQDFFDMVEAEMEKREADRHD